MQLGDGGKRRGSLGFCWLYFGEVDFRQSGEKGCCHCLVLLCFLNKLCLQPKFLQLKIISKLLLLCTEAGDISCSYTRTQDPDAPSRGRAGTPSPSVLC